MASRNPRSIVLLVAENEEGLEVEQIDVSYDEYYGGELAIVDSDEYRKSKGIRRLKGKIYSHKRTLVQEFVVEYDPDGRYARSRTIHDDGTIVED